MACIPRRNNDRRELRDLLDKCIANYRTTCLVYVDRDFRLSWKEFGEEVDRVAKGLMAME